MSSEAASEGVRVHDATEAETRRIVEAVYAAHRSHDLEALVGLLAPDVEVTFLGRGTFANADAFRAHLTGGTSGLRNVDLQLKTLIIDGTSAAGIWEETAETASGQAYHNHGVDVFAVRDGAVNELVICDDVVHYRKATAEEPVATQHRSEDG